MKKTSKGRRDIRRRMETAGRLTLGTLAVLAMIPGTIWLVVLTTIGVLGLAVSWGTEGVSWPMLALSLSGLIAVLTCGLLSYGVLFQVFELCLGWDDRETGPDERARRMVQVEQGCLICVGVLLATCAVWGAVMAATGGWTSEFLGMTACFGLGYALAALLAHGIRRRCACGNGSKMG